MKVNYSDKIQWKIEIETTFVDPIILSKSFKSDIKNTLSQLESHNYKIEIETVSDSFFDEFEPVYSKFILTKSNPQSFNTRDKVLTSILPGIYKAFVIRKNRVFVGALIFREFQDLISCAYKVFPHKLDFYYRSNLAAVVDYFGLDYAIKYNFKTYSLGKDRNIYGQNTEIGLARYKISIGALPYISKVAKMVTLDTEMYKPEADSLIFYTDIPDQISLNKALLYTNLPESEIKNKYGALFKQEKIEFQIINY
jgi:hypothetical protein